MGEKKIYLEIVFAPSPLHGLAFRLVHRHIKGSTVFSPTFGDIPNDLSFVFQLSFGLQDIFELTPKKNSRLAFEGSHMLKAIQAVVLAVLARVFVVVLSSFLVVRGSKLSSRHLNGKRVRVSVCRRA